MYMIKDGKEITISSGDERLGEVIINYVPGFEFGIGLRAGGILLNSTLNFKSFFKGKKKYIYVFFSVY
jgi:hypothetical protein